MRNGRKMTNKLTNVFLMWRNLGTDLIWPKVDFEAL